MSCRPKHFRSTCLCLFVALSLLLTGDAHARVYRVKKGDWLGKIARRFLPGDPFRKKGGITTIVHLNPDIHDPNQIVPNELLYIPEPTIDREAKPTRYTSGRHARVITLGNGATLTMGPLTILEKNASPPPDWTLAHGTVHISTTAHSASITIGTPYGMIQTVENEASSFDVDAKHQVRVTQGHVKISHKGKTTTVSAGQSYLAPEKLPSVAKRDASASRAAPPVDVTSAVIHDREAKPAPPVPTTPRPDDWPARCDCKPTVTAPAFSFLEATQGPASCPPPDPACGRVSEATRRQLRLRLAPYYRFSELTAQDDNTGAIVRLASRYNTGVTAGLGIDAVSFLRLNLDLRGGVLGYTSPSQNVTNLVSGLFSFDARVDAELLFSRLAIYLGVDYGNEPFSTADSTQIQEVRMTNLLGALGGLRLVALRWDKWIVGCMVESVYKLGATERDYTIHPGLALYGGAYAQWFNSPETAWTLHLGYAQRNADTTLIVQTDRSIGLELSYRWSFNAGTMPAR